MRSNTKEEISGKKNFVTSFFFLENDTMVNQNLPE